MLHPMHPAVVCVWIGRGASLRYQTRPPRRVLTRKGRVLAECDRSGGRWRLHGGRRCRRGGRERVGYRARGARDGCQR
jgi:hypothetical protein